jgi:hypothetical protein
VNRSLLGVVEGHCFEARPNAITTARWSAPSALTVGPPELATAETPGRDQPPRAAVRPSLTRMRCTKPARDWFAEVVSAGYFAGDRCPGPSAAKVLRRGGGGTVPEKGVRSGTDGRPRVLYFIYLC